MSHKNSTSVVPTSVEAAAMEAAMADGLISANGLYITDEKAKKAGLRRGKWTSEEEAYANRLIHEFKQGLLPLTEGTTLRTFLSKLLNCDPMRISKKFVGANCIGKQVFRRRQQELEKLSPEQIEVQRKELGELERKFLERVASTNRSKSAALQAVTASVDVKDSRTSYDGDVNGAIPVPWSAPPNQIPLTDLSSVAAEQLLGMGGNSSSAGAQYFYKQLQQQQSFGQNSSSSYSSHQLQPPTLGLAPYPYNSDSVPPASAQTYSNIYRSVGSQNESSSFSRATSLEMLNSIAQMGSSTGSLENMATMSDASALKQQQLMYQNQQQMRMMHAFGGGGTGSSGGGIGDPTADVFPGLVRATSDNNNGSTLTFGDSVGWPSFSNLNSLSGGIGGGGSMDDLLSAGLLSRQVSGGSPFDLDGPSNSSSDGKFSSNNKYLGMSSAAAEESTSLGYSLEDSNSPGVGAKSPQIMRQDSLSAQVRVKAPIVDMSVMRQQQQQKKNFSSAAPSTAHSDGNQNMYEKSRDYNSNLPSVNKDNGVSRSVEQERLFDGNSQSTEPSRLSGSIPKNGSVEDFWMLVNMGDLPQPEQNVLSQMVWSPLERASAAAAALAASAPPPPSLPSSGVPFSVGSEKGINNCNPDYAGPLTMSPQERQKHLQRSDIINVDDDVKEKCVKGNMEESNDREHKRPKLETGL